MSAGTRRDESEGEEELEVTDGELAVELWNDEGVNPATGEVYGYGRRYCDSQHLQDLLV